MSAPSLGLALHVRQLMCRVRSPRGLAIPALGEGLAQPEPSFAVLMTKEAQGSSQCLSTDITISSEVPWVSTDITGEPGGLLIDTGLLILFSLPSLENFPPGP